MKLHGFFDDSCGERDSFRVVCGIIMPEDRIDRFRSEWRRVLAEHGVSTLKMSNLWGKRGEFGAMMHREERELLAMRLANCIRNYGVAIAASCLPNQVYDRVVKGNLPESVDDSFWMIFQGVRIASMRVAEEVGASSLKLTFDSQGEGMERRGYQMGDPAIFSAGINLPFELLPVSFVDDKNEPGIQAADMLAWGFRRKGEVLHGIGDSTMPLFYHIIDTMPHEVEGWGESDMIEFLNFYLECHPNYERITPMNITLADVLLERHVEFKTHKKGYQRNKRDNIIVDARSDVSDETSFYDSKGKLFYWFTSLSVVSSDTNAMLIIKGDQETIGPTFKVGGITLENGKAVIDLNEEGIKKLQKIYASTKKSKEKAAYYEIPRVKKSLNSIIESYYELLDRQVTSDG